MNKVAEQVLKAVKEAMREQSLIGQYGPEDEPGDYEIITNSHGSDIRLFCTMNPNVQQASSDIQEILKLAHVQYQVTNEAFLAVMIGFRHD